MADKRFFREQADRFTALQHALRQAFDPFGLACIAIKTQRAWQQQPATLADTLIDWGSDAWQWQQHTASRLAGAPDIDLFPSHPDDTRFADPIWSDSPQWDAVKEWYLFNTRWLQDVLYATPGLSDVERNRSAFWLRQWLNAIAPTNCFWLNPGALTKAALTRGDSVWQGYKNFVRDLGRGDIPMTDMEAFKVGENLATTPGTVVHRNRLLEVIQYAPTTPEVKAVPIIIVAPWINKFYVLDLDAKKSLIRYLVDQGYTVFVTSWKNPGSDEHDIGFDDYVSDGIATIVDVARTASGSDQVHLAGYCIGGTLTATYLAWLAKRGEADKVASATFLTTMTDFARPGDIDVFLDDEGVAFVERVMAKKGYLDGKEMASSFRMLRPNSLIWNYWVSSYLLGEVPTAFDVLYWNMDTTRMPQKMHSYYLREFYVSNRLIEPDALTIAGEKIDLSSIETPMFIVGTQEDHIAPWQQTWALAGKARGPVTYTLSSSGHILGIINPPRPDSKRSYWQGEAQRGESAETWLARQQSATGSWWPSWVEWLAPRSGKDVKPPVAKSNLGPAPGQYVLE